MNWRLHCENYLLGGRYSYKVGLRIEAQQTVESSERLTLAFTYVQPILRDSFYELVIANIKYYLES